MNAKISVVIPAFNEERYLDACLQSLRVQDIDQPFEIIVVDNNSTDATAAIAAKYGARVITENKRGVCFARQAGTEAARGQIIVSTDADSVFSPDWLRKISHDFQKHPNVVAVAGTVSFQQAPWWGNVYTKILFGFIQTVYKRTGRVRYITACNTAFRKSAWDGYNTKLTQGGDELDLLKKLSAHGPMLFRRDNIVTTSSRRMHHGLLYSIVVTSFFYYFFNYYVGRVTGRSFFGSYSAIRTERAKWSSLRALGRTVAIIAVFFLTYTLTIHPATAKRLVRNTGSRIDVLADRVHFPHPPYFR